ncbi:hypothetical protein [Nocardia terpenica]|uniref:TPR repeat domain-containing protein n=1 Tax=Nocardia terpenica TaxID=455432 RepID=A0A6G9YZX4_9NOCA|nr:hypothetical protein [Nocardia terpenica]QIS18899.1 hypothetical protein F6W96_11945 [Nocardia terpenica]
MTEWALTRANVGRWNAALLTDLATIVEAQNGTYESEVGRMPKHFQDLGASWAGQAHDAAYDRIGEDHRQSLKIKDEVSDLVAILREAGSRLISERANILGKVADTEDTSKAVAKETLKVGDNWQITITYPAGVSEDDKAKILDRAQGQQGLINTAWYSLRDAAHQADQLIREAAQDIRDAGSNFGDGVDAPIKHPGTDRHDPTVKDGADDGKLVADGKATPEDLQRIADHLAQTTHLTPDQLAALANGGDVTIPASSMSYLQSFYGNSGRDGLLTLSDQLRANGSPESLALQRNLGDGLMLLSNDHAVTRDSAGTIQDRGGWNKLHPEIRELVGTRPGTLISGTDANTRDLPDDYRGRDGKSKYNQDMSRFATLVDSADKSYSPGAKFGVELSRQAAHQAFLSDYLGAGGRMEIIDRPTDDTIQHLLDAGTRSKEADQALITGHGSEELFGKNTPGQDYHPYDPNKMLTTLMKHRWDDGGETLGKMYRWIDDDSHSPDLAVTTRAGETASGLSSYLTRNSDLLMNLRGPHTESLGELNPHAVQALSSALSPYVADMTGALPPNLMHHGFTPPDPGNDHARHGAQQIFALMDTDKQAATQFNAKALVAAQELQSAWVNSALDDPDNRLTGAALAAGRLQGLVDQGLTLELKDRSQDIANSYAHGFADKGAAYDTIKTVLTTGIKYVPIVGDVAQIADPIRNVSSTVIDVGNPWAKNAIVGLSSPPAPPQPQIDTHTNFQPAQLAYQVGHTLETRDGTLAHDHRYSYLFDSGAHLKDYRTLIDSDHVTEEQIYSDMTNIVTSYRNHTFEAPYLLLDKEIRDGRNSIQ